MGIHLMTEANRCLQCKKPMCMEACPIHTNIPQIISLIKSGDRTEAERQLFENNPMSAVCAIICDHEAQCAGHCVLGRKASPVQFYEIEKYISDSYLDKFEAETKGPKKDRIAIIGSGPAGLTAAILLAKKGYPITIFEEKEAIGGMLRYGIPEFRLSNNLVDKYKEVLDKLNVKVRPNTVLGGALKIDDLFRDGYKAVFVATGVWRPKTLGIVGESLSNVHYGIAYLSKPDAFRLGSKVAIIGMGNVAMDVARTAIRHGSKEVTLYARSKRIAASNDELEFARFDGARFEFGYDIDSITDKGPVFKIARFDENDKVIGYEEDTVQIMADSTIIAISQVAKNKLILTTDDLKANDKGLLITDENCMTTVPGVFAAGDVVHGSNTVVHAACEAKRAAYGIIKYLDNLSR
ncbi:MAG: FAD-dependent oxidoreductase [Butyrivibrio sp.]|uniref:FAD-dependent oxidoreductase n=1 Tax=Butyrivibrio sp. TaxID=28121 RepID=UPI0025F18BEB|nr:FAD-dependent oxidoreductase [Butyrivibrio sp.]MCR5772196.1 FAD-dependent oxidoreductase [Butyrivibrio sp.]